MWLQRCSTNLERQLHRTLSLDALLSELKASSQNRNLEHGKHLHKAAIHGSLDSNHFVANTLINMYGKCGSMDDALRVFSAMQDRSVVSWNALILGYADNGEGQMALELFSGIAREGYEPSSRSFVAAFKACTELAALQGHAVLVRAKAVHLLASRCGGDLNIFVQGTLVDMYAKCRTIEDARRVFEMMQLRDNASWNALIKGYAENGQGETALHLFSRMECEGCAPNAVSFVVSVMACTKLDGNESVNAKVGSICLLASCKGYDRDIYVNNTLLDAYAKCGRMVDALAVFRRMQYRDVVSWNTLILGYAENGEDGIALDLFCKMGDDGCPPDTTSFVAALKACSDLVELEGKAALERGRPVHLLASFHHYDTCIYVESILVDMYAKCGDIDDVRKMFDRMTYRDLVSWNALILGYAENGEGELAIELFSRLGDEGWEPNERTFVAALKACTKIAEKQEDVSVGGTAGKAMHCLVSSCGCDVNMYVQNTLVDMYCKCGYMDDARRAFDAMVERDVVTWNSLILGYAENGKGDIAVDFFSRLRSEGCVPDQRTFVAALKACIELAEEQAADGLEEVWNRGKAVQLLAASFHYDSNIFVANTLVDLYSKCCRMEDARMIFEQLQQRDIVSWTILMLGYVENGQGREVLELFARMKREGCEPDALTFVAALKACGLLGALESGRAVHSEICTRGLDAPLANYLVDFYAKCGSQIDAELVFDRAQPTSDLITWNALMAGYGSHGNTRGVFHLLERLLNTSVQPDGITLLIVLTACSHGGHLEKGKQHFEALTTKYRIVPNVEHYACMLDVLGRANKLEDTMALLRSMPLSPCSSTWMTVLAACQKWQNAELARLAFESVTRLDDTLGAAYTLMANVRRVSE